jgi:hypothetical protein
VDVRRFPGSRSNPDVGRDALLDAAGEQWVSPHRLGAGG